MTSNAGWTERTRPPVGRQQSRADRQKRDAVSHPARPQPLCEKRENRTAGRSCPPRLFSVSNGAGRRLPGERLRRLHKQSPGRDPQVLPTARSRRGFQDFTGPKRLSLYHTLFVRGKSRYLSFFGENLFKTQSFFAAFCPAKQLAHETFSIPFA